MTTCPARGLEAGGDAATRLADLVVRALGDDNPYLTGWATVYRSSPPAAVGADAYATGVLHALAALVGDDDADAFLARAIPPGPRAAERRRREPPLEDGVGTLRRENLRGGP